MPTTPEQWNRVKEIVASALERPVQDRVHFVRSECGGDEALFSEAVSLLRYAAETEGCSPPLLKNRYRIDSELGRGGFAVTYLAFDTHLHDRRVVVKMLANSGAEPYVQRKFEEEIQALSRLKHPNIITPLDCGRTDDNVPFLVMQFAEGQTLRQLMRQGPIDPQVAASIIKQLGNGVAAAHRDGIIHRDIKPENVMVETFADGSVHVWLIDFGISSMTDASGRSVTRIVGTRSYMAPEQYGGEVSTKSDVFSLGVLIYELLAGSLPFGDGSPLEIMERQRSGRIALPSPRQGKLDARIDMLLSRALAYEVEKRPPSVQSLTDEIAGRIAKMTTPERPVKHRKILLPVAAAIAVVAIPALLIFQVHPKKPVIPAPPAGRQVTPLETKPPPSQSPVALPLVRIDLRRASSQAGPATDQEGALIMDQRERFRLVAEPLVAGHLYLLAQSIETADLHILFPSPTANQGRSAVESNHPVTIPASHWFTFGSTVGTEILIFFWSAAPDPVMEDAKRFANAKDQGAIPEGPAQARIRELLRSPNTLKAAQPGFQLSSEKDTACGWITIKHN